MSKIPLWGQEPSIPVWVAYLLQAEVLWTIIAAFTLALFIFDDAIFEGVPLAAQICAGLMLGGVLGPFIRWFVRIILKSISTIV